jgi:hypothetical protein
MVDLPYKHYIYTYCPNGHLSSELVPSHTPSHAQSGHPVLLRLQAIILHV